MVSLLPRQIEKKGYCSVALVLLCQSILADGVERDHSEPWEFTCPRCGIDFTAPEDDLVFQSVPKEWLLAKIHAA